jgi:hypothetical protein
MFAHDGKNDDRGEIRYDSKSSHQDGIEFRQGGPEVTNSVLAIETKNRGVNAGDCCVLISCFFMLHRS